MNKKDNTICVNGKEIIGKGLVPYVIAEIGTNHDQDIEKAKYMIREIAKTDCDCVKFQIYEANEIVSGGIQCSDYGLENIYGSISGQMMFDKYLKTPKEWFPELTNLVHELNMHCMVTLHGDNGIDWAIINNFDLIKVASMDHTNLPFLERLVEKIKVPILISFGMAELEDIDLAMAILKNHTPGVAIFYCVAIYPPGPGEISLNNIPFLEDRYNLPVGFSDHTISLSLASGALACGAKMFEKHVTPDKTLSGPDHPFALEFDELNTYISGLKETFSFLGDKGFQAPSERECKNRDSYLKSLIAKRDLAAGEILKAEDLYIARPGTGIKPRYFDSVINSKLVRAVSAETPILWQDIERKELSES